MTQLNLNLDSMKRDWLDEAVAWFRRAGRTVGLFTSDDLHAYLPPPSHWNWFGAFVAKLRMEGLIEEVGRRASSRPEANGRKVSVWRAKA